MFNIFKKGKKEKALARVVTPEWGRYSEYPSCNLTPEKLTNIFREADYGNVSRQMELFEEMEEKDPHLFSQLQTRKNAVCGLDWEIIAFSENERDKQIAEFVKNIIKSINDFDGALMDLLDAIGKGISFLEIVWKEENGFLKIEDLKYIHQKHFFWDEKDNLKIITKDNSTGILVKEIQENKIIMHKYKARSGQEARAGLLRVVAWMYLFKNYTLKDWVTFNEKYGMPLIIGKYDESSSEDEKNALLNALISLGTDSAGVISRSTEIEIKDNDKKSSSDIYEKMARFCDEQMSKAILGQTLTSDSGGSYAQSKTHNEVRRDLTSADCKALASTLKEYLIKPIVELNFGESYNIPDFVFDFEEAEDLLNMAEVYSKLINEIGLKIDSDHIYEKFKIPKPEEIKLTEFKEKSSRISQQKVDNIVEELKKDSIKNFKNSLEFFKKEIENIEDTRELKNIFEDEKKLEKILKNMNYKFNQESLKGGLIISNLIGRYQDE